MNFSLLTTRDLEALIESAERVGWNGLATLYLRELIRRKYRRVA